MNDGVVDGRSSTFLKVRPASHRTGILSAGWILGQPLVGMLTLYRRSGGKVTTLMQIPERTELYFVILAILWSQHHVPIDIQGFEWERHSPALEALMAKHLSTPRPHYLPPHLHHRASIDERKHKLSVLRALVSSPPPMIIAEASLPCLLYPWRSICRYTLNDVSYVPCNYYIYYDSSTQRK